VDTHRLRVCSFNACKMRLGNANKPYREGSGPPEAYEGSHKGAELTQKWLTLSAIMSDFDVIVLQEVPGTEKVMDEKIEKFAAMLDVATEEGRFWTAINSEKSGKDGQVTGPSAEVHVCFVKSPVELKKWGTLRKVGCTELDYAPLQVVVHDPRFAETSDRDFVITSVHLPPSKRRDARDSQIAALLRNYAAPDTSEHRMQLPFAPNKETKQAPVHLICGDFNTYPGQDQYQMQANGFVSKIPKHAATTSGHENYDNVLINGHANDTFLIGGGILQLKDPHNASQSKIGLSDHFPVFVEVQEVLRTKRSATKLPVVEWVVGGAAPPPPPPPLNPVPEEVEAPSPPLAEAPTDIWDRLSEEAKNSNPNYNLHLTKPEFTDDLEEGEVSDTLTDGPDLPRWDHDDEHTEQADETTEDAVAAVVHAAMEKVAEAVVKAATKGEEAEEAEEAGEAVTHPGAPPAAAPSTEERPATPPPAQAPPPDAEAGAVPPATEIPRPHPQEGSAAAPEPEAAADAEEAPSEAASLQENAGGEEGALEAPAPEAAPEAEAEQEAAPEAEPEPEPAPEAEQEPAQSPPPPESARAADGEA
jgi:endonuclease/exonuclease/phosphatase family metal-dependent hydrolase